MDLEEDGMIVENFGEGFCQDPRAPIILSRFYSRRERFRSRGTGRRCWRPWGSSRSHRGSRRRVPSHFARIVAVFTRGRKRRGSVDEWRLLYYWTRRCR